MPQPLISVILPTYNRLQLFHRSLASVLAQTYADIEVIVVDNASTDGTAAFLAGMADPRLRCLRLPSLVGASAARNAALAQAHGELVAFQDDDDIWLPDKLERQAAQLLREPAEVGLCLCGYLRLTRDGAQPIYARRYFDGMDFDTGVARRDFSVIATPGWLARKRFIEQAGGFDELMPARNDWELALRLQDICRFTYVEAPLFVQDRTRETTMMGNTRAYTAALKRLVAIHGHRWQRFPLTVARHARLIGTQLVRSGEIQEGRRWLLESLRHEVWQPKLVLLYLMSHVGRGLVGAASAAQQKLREMRG